MNDFVSMPNDEINRYMKMEKLLENKISRRFKVRRLEINDFGYLTEHLYGRDGIAYEDYEYQLPKKKLKKETLIKYYDLIRPTRCVVEESQRYLRLEHEDKESYVSYFTVNAIVGELDFPSSEIFYFQQQQFTFPVDTSMNVEIVENRKALTTVRNKKKELKDLDNHAYQAGSETSSNVVDALDSVDELETDLDQTKESMYKLSYVIRVSADDLDELKRRCDEVKDFYDDLNVKLVRPAGDMLGLHSEFLPASKRYINDYVQYVKSDFLAGLGFGATQQLGENTGIYMGYSVDTGRNVYLQPSLASQGVKGTVTNALASAFVGSLGGGKSFCNNLLVYYSVLFGGQAVILDPKSERGNWKETLPEIAHEINIVNLTSDKDNAGLLDPFVITYEVDQQIKEGEQTTTVKATYTVKVHVDADRDMVIIQNPTLAPAIEKSDYEPKTPEADASVDADTVNDATAFLETFFKLYPTATAKELAYYVFGNVLEPIGRDYLYSELVNPVLTKDGDNMKVKVAVKFLDNQTKATQVLQYELILHKDSNWKIIM